MFGCAERMRTKENKKKEEEEGRKRGKKITLCSEQINENIISMENTAYFLHCT